MKRLTIVVLLASVSCFASDTYFAATSAGSNNGTDCADAYAYNNGTHGLGVGGTWVAGATLHLCGTFTASGGASAYIRALGSGSAGNPVILKFETGAVLTAPYWGINGAIYSNGENYVTVDGGTNGTITSTANGTGLANQASTANGVHFQLSSNVEIKNLTISNIYVHTCTLPVSNCTDTSAGSAYAVQVYGGSNVLIHDNTINDAKACIYYSAAASLTQTNLSIYNNTLSNCNWEIGVGDAGTSAILTGFLIYGNSVTVGGNWDTATDTYHMDGIFVFSSWSSSVFSGGAIYNNYVTGPPGPCCNTALTYISADPGSGVEGLINGTYVFNNIYSNPSTTNYFSDGEAYDISNGALYLNNTIVSMVGPEMEMYEYGSTGNAGITAENNIMVGALNGSSNLVWLHSGLSVLTDYNDFYSGTYVADYQGSYYSTLAAWQASSGTPDLHSINGNPNLTGAFLLNAGSPAIGAGTNLTSVCSGQPNPGLGALCFGAPQTFGAGSSCGTGCLMRPASGPWDMGANPYAATATPSAPVPWFLALTLRDHVGSYVREAAWAPTTSH
jgi:hypothetical protein